MEKKDYLAPALEEMVLEEEAICAASVPSQDEPEFGGEVDPGVVVPD